MATADPDASRSSNAARTSLPDWTIVVPAYNEAERLGETLRAIAAFAAGHTGTLETLVVDDGSTDGTTDLVEREFPNVRLVRNPGNRGKGYSVRAGLRAGRGKWRLFSDADLSTPIDELPRFEAELRAGADIVIASRAMNESMIELHQAWWRETSGRVFNGLVRLISGLPYRDTQCGFKAYTRAAAMRVAALQKLDGWAFDVEHLHIARLLGLCVREVPVRWINSPASHVRFLPDSARMLLDVIRVRHGHYDLSRTEKSGADAEP